MTTHYHSQYWAHALSLRGSGGNIESLSRSIANARVDLNPHQIDAALVQSLQDKLEAQKAIKALEKIRNTKRRELFKAQDAIDVQREALIEGIEKQLRQRRGVERVFVVRWAVR